MPKAELPTSFAGWVVAVLTGAVGFIAGFLFLAMLEQFGIT
jgi:hypothetical protein